MKRISVKQITEGAIYAAVYGLLAILTRYLINSTDSMLYYFYPIPLCIYARKSSLKGSLLVLFSSIALSFIFGNPIFVFGIILPNIIIGFVFGILDKFQSVKIVNYLICYALLFGSNYLSIYIYSVINGIGYFDGTVELVRDIFNNLVIDEVLITRVVNIAINAVLLVDSLVKLVLIILIYNIIIKRLKLVKDYNTKVIIPLKYTPMNALLYIANLCALYIITVQMVISKSMFIDILLVILFTTAFIFTFYFIYQSLIFFRLKLKKVKPFGMIIITILCFVLSPLTVLLSVILNFFRYNFVLDAVN